MEDLSSLKSIVVESIEKIHAQRNFHVYKNLNEDRQLLYNIISSDIYNFSILMPNSDHTNVDILEVNNNDLEDQELIYRMVISNNVCTNQAIIFKIDGENVEEMGSIVENYIPMYYSAHCELNNSTLQNYGSMFQIPLIVPGGKNIYDSMFYLPGNGSIVRTGTHIPMFSSLSNKMIDIDPISYQITFPENGSMSVKFLSLLSALYLDNTIFGDSFIFNETIPASKTALLSSGE